MAERANPKVIKEVTDKPKANSENQEASAGFDPSNLVSGVAVAEEAAGNGEEGAEKIENQTTAEENQGKPKVANDNEGKAEESDCKINITLPVGDCFPGYATSNIDFNATRRQAAAAKVLWCSLSKSGERFMGGRSSNPEGTTVEGANDGIRWMLDQIADAIEEQSGKKLTEDLGLSF